MRHQFKEETNNIEIIFYKHLIIESCIYIILMYKEIINLYIKWYLYVAE
jgi:hypothetical protein